MRLHLLLGKHCILPNDVPKGKWSVHPNHKKQHTFPLTVSVVWQDFELSTAGTSAANPIQWS